jgi:hypothetical protein
MTLFVKIITFFRETENKYQRFAFKCINFFRRHYYLLKESLSTNFYSKKELSKSKVLIDVVIPTIEKDLEILPYTIRGVLDNLAHNINNIFLIAPNSPKIKSFCKSKKLKFIDENSLFPFTKKDITYSTPEGDRSGWIFQQLIKLYGEFVETDYFFVIDSDTVLTKPQIFLKDEKTVLLVGDDWYPPYFKFFEKLFFRKRKLNFSFISHQMLFNKRVLQEMKNEIELNYNKKWYLAIIELIKNTKKNGVIGDYEIYGSYLIQKYPNKVIKEYWFNKTATIKDPKIYLDKYQVNTIWRSISFHSYIKYKR